MQNSRQLVIFGLCLVSFVLMISIAESKPQLTFSTNWDGGKRSGNSDYNELDSLYEDRIRLKRRPGWGKRAAFRFDQVNQPDELRALRLNRIYNEPKVNFADQWFDSDEKN